MKRIILVLLFFPVCAFAQVSMNVEAIDFVSPGDNQSFMHVEFISHQPVRIDECTIDFENDRIFDFVDRLTLYQDDELLPVLSHASEWLYNPWTHYPSVYVGIGNDTVTIFDYKIDTYRHYSQDLNVSITCVVDYYTDPSTSDTTIGPIEISSIVILDVQSYDINDVLKVSHNFHGLDIQINTRFCEPILVTNVLGEVVAYVYDSCVVSLNPGSYVLYSETCGYIGKYIVQ